MNQQIINMENQHQRIMLSYDAPTGNKDPDKLDCCDIKPGREHCSNDGCNRSGDQGHLVTQKPIMSCYEDSSDSKDIVHSDTTLQHQDIIDGARGHRMESDNKVEIGNPKPPSVVQTESNDCVYPGRNIECLDIKQETYGTYGCDSNSEDIKWMHGIENQIECPVCGVQFDNITEYTHHLTMHLEKSEQSEEGTISIDWPSSQIQSDQDSTCVIKMKSSQQDQNGQIDSDIHRNNETSLNSKLHVQVDFENSQKLESFPIGTSYDKSVGSKLDNTAHPKPLSCTMCDKSFTNNFTLNRHMKNIHKLCDKSFAERCRATSENKKDHNKNVKTFPCTLCDKSFARKENLRGHISVVHDKIKPFCCTLCDKSFAEKKTLTRHIDAIHHKLKPFSCTLCDKSFIAKSDLNRHVGTVHEKLKCFTCTFCYNIFSTKSNLSRHVDEIHKKLKRFNCALCDKSFSQKGTLTVHVNKIHNVNEKSESSVQIDDNHQGYVLSGDGKSELCLPTHDTHTHHDNNAIKVEPLFLQDDKYMITTQKPFSCTLYDKSFSQPAHLSKHVAAVHGKSFTCTLCDKSFTSKQSLTMHIDSVHKNLKPFSCTLCDKSFSRKGYLKKHFDVVHRKLKSFSCTFCDDTFSTKSNLSEHMDRMHEKRKTFSCTVCKKSFMFEDNLIFHQQIHGHGQTSPAMKRLDTTNCGENIHENFGSNHETKGELMSKPVNDNETKYQGEIYDISTQIKSEYL